MMRRVVLVLLLVVLVVAAAVPAGASVRYRTVELRPAIVGDVSGRGNAVRFYADDWVYANFTDLPGWVLRDPAGLVAYAPHLPVAGVFIDLDSIASSMVVAGASRVRGGDVVAAQISVIAYSNSTYRVDLSISFYSLSGRSLTATAVVDGYAESVIVLVLSPVFKSSSTNSTAVIGFRLEAYNSSFSLVGSAELDAYVFNTTGFDPAELNGWWCWVGAGIRAVVEDTFITSFVPDAAGASPPAPLTLDVYAYRFLDLEVLDWDELFAELRNGSAIVFSQVSSSVASTVYSTGSAAQLEELVYYAGLVLLAAVGPFAASLARREYGFEVDDRVAYVAAGVAAAAGAVFILNDVLFAFVLALPVLAAVLNAD